MFTGLIETIGVIVAIDKNDKGTTFGLQSSIIPDMVIGESLAVNGVCLTLTKIVQDIAYVQAVPETLRITTLNALALGQKVNLERALLANGRMGGHVVLGHVDTTTSILDTIPDGNARTIRFALPQSHQPYVVPKGQIAIDGMSLTIVSVDTQAFVITFIPHTQQATIAGHYQNGDCVNVEFDILAKYVLKQTALQSYRELHHE